VVWTGLDWSVLGRTARNGLDWTGLNWIGLDLTGLDWTGGSRNIPQTAPQTASVGAIRLEGMQQEAKKSPPGLIAIPLDFPWTPYKRP